MGEWTLTPCICYYRLVNSTLKEKQWYIMGDWTLTPCKYHYRHVHCTIKEKQRYTMSEWTLTWYLYHYRHVDCKLKESERTLKPCMHHYKKCTLHFRRKATIEGVRLNTNFVCFTGEMYTTNGKKNNKVNWSYIVHQNKSNTHDHVDEWILKHCWGIPQIHCTSKEKTQSTLRNELWQ